MFQGLDPDCLVLAHVPVGETHHGSSSRASRSFPSEA
ncbi:hypothetical protein [Arthrobacter citreus]